MSTPPAATPPDIHFGEVRFHHHFLASRKENLAITPLPHNEGCTPLEHWQQQLAAIKLGSMSVTADR